MMVQVSPPLKMKLHHSTFLSALSLHVWILDELESARREGGGWLRKGELGWRLHFGNYQIQIRNRQLVRYLIVFLLMDYMSCIL